MEGKVLYETHYTADEYGNKRYNGRQTVTCQFTYHIDELAENMQLCRTLYELRDFPRTDTETFEAPE